MRGERDTDRVSLLAELAEAADGLFSWDVYRHCPALCLLVGDFLSSLAGRVVQDIAESPDLPFYVREALATSRRWLARTSRGNPGDVGQLVQNQQRRIGALRNEFREIPVTWANFSFWCPIARARWPLIASVHESVGEQQEQAYSRVWHMYSRNAEEWRQKHNGVGAGPLTLVDLCVLEGHERLGFVVIHDDNGRENEGREEGAHDGTRTIRLARAPCAALFEEGRLWDKCTSFVEGRGDLPLFADFETAILRGLERENVRYELTRVYRDLEVALDLTDNARGTDEDSSLLTAAVVAQNMTLWTMLPETQKRTYFFLLSSEVFHHAGEGLSTPAVSALAVNSREVLPQEDEQLLALANRLFMGPLVRASYAVAHLEALGRLRLVEERGNLGARMSARCEALMQPGEPLYWLTHLGGRGDDTSTVAKELWQALQRNENSEVVEYFCCFREFAKCPEGEVASKARELFVDEAADREGKFRSRHLVQGQRVVRAVDNVVAGTNGRVTLQQTTLPFMLRTKEGNERSLLEEYRVWLPTSQAKDGPRGGTRSEGEAAADGPVVDELARAFAKMAIERLQATEVSVGGRLEEGRLPFVLWVILEIATNGKKYEERVAGEANDRLGDFQGVLALAKRVMKCRVEAGEKNMLSLWLPVIVPVEVREHLAWVSRE